MPYFLVRPVQPRPWNMGAMAHARSRNSVKRMLKGSHLDMRDTRIDEVPFEDVEIVLDKEDLRALREGGIIPLPNREDYISRWTKGEKE